MISTEEERNKAIQRIQSSTRSLLNFMPWYGHLMLRVKRQVTEKIPTMAVSLDGIDFKLLFNPIFVNSIPETKQFSKDRLAGILQHEILHVCYNHLSLMKTFQNKEIANIAMDLEINQVVGRNLLPNGHLTKEDYKKQFDPFWEDLEKKYKDEQISEEQYKREMWNSNNMYFQFAEDYFPQEEPRKGSLWYYKNLLKDAKKVPSISMEQMKQLLNDIDESEGAGSDESELAENQWKFLAKEALKDLGVTGPDGVKSCGNIPADLQEWLEGLFSGKKESVNWRALFRNFITGSMKAYRVPTRKRPSKRYPRPAPGSRTETVPRGIIYWDQSGSVSQREHEMLFDELHHIHKTGVDIDIAPFNTRVLTVYEYKGENNYTRAGGGTDFEPCVEHFNKHSNKYSFAIMFTDGEAPIPGPFRKPVIWVLTNNYYMGPEYRFPGHKILMKDEQE
jgi:predicted metal-dependent peptidase